MARRYVLINDFHGEKLPEDTSPISLTLGHDVLAVSGREELRQVA